MGCCYERLEIQEVNDGFCYGLLLLTAETLNRHSQSTHFMFQLSNDAFLLVYQSLGIFQLGQIIRAICIQILQPSLMCRRFGVSIKCGAR